MGCCCGSQSQKWSELKQIDQNTENVVKHAVHGAIVDNVVQGLLQLDDEQSISPDDDFLLTTFSQLPANIPYIPKGSFDRTIHIPLSQLKTIKHWYEKEHVLKLIAQRYCKTALKKFGVNGVMQYTVKTMGVHTDRFGKEWIYNGDVHTDHTCCTYRITIRGEKITILKPHDQASAPAETEGKNKGCL